MIFFLISIFAGVLTVLAPCVLPLLPIVIGSTEGSARGISRRAFVVITSLSLSVIVFTLLLRATTVFIAIPESFWVWFSGSIIVLVGLAIIFPNIWSSIPLVNKLSQAGNKAVGIGYQKKSYRGDILIGAALGPVFTTCSPTYLFIIATVLPATFITGFVYLIGFTLGLAFSLFVIAYFGERLVGRIVSKMGTATRIKQIFGILILIVGIGILTGYDKKLQTAILDSGYGATIIFEDGLIERFGNDSKEELKKGMPAVSIPPHLRKTFSKTDWSKTDPRIAYALSGGPGKDGIPSIDKPIFEAISNFKHQDSVQAIVMKDGNTAKVYPYNILVWHEIVNDTVDGVPVAITFCPLCGSAIVFERSLTSGVTTFGVSGSLLESNLIMYDRATETLWQQSTGRALAGEHFNVELALSHFQLMTIGEARKLYPQASVLSEKTGYRRDYGRNPYSGYEDSDDFIFLPSSVDTKYPSKTIMVAFRYGNTSVAVPWLSVLESQVYDTRVNNENITIAKKSGELSITDANGKTIPFYFEMWFSWAVQHGDGGIVFDPQKN